MRKPKRDDTSAADARSAEECRVLGRVCLVAVCVLCVWGVLYMPPAMRSGVATRVTLPDHLAWMVSQSDVALYVRPDNDTSFLAATPTSATPTCNGSGVFLAVVVCSAVANAGARNAIRDTWAQDAKHAGNLRVFFLLGKSPNDSLNALVSSESEKFGDIIQQDFVDSYNNLTIKSVMMLKWATEHCSKANFIMKTDDDMFVHLPNLFRLLKTKKKTAAKNLLLGCLIKGATPVKDWHSKWYVPDSIFPGRVYPPYLSGTGYVLSRNAVTLLYRTALSTPFFYLEDVFVTGICASRAGLSPTNHEGFKFYKRKSDTCAFRSLITAHRMSPKELRQMWANIHNPSIKCKKS
ncbi:hypothetical protein JTE90_010794 [Oedothorax gibbosus]|uniref:Hexosyltransferase n=1 Tax=Oedothorax gibbosus TaxID=931172 RepID=A0AAV6VFP8_9ARAC|nr:hypothetical protein JTE90_010794 [Oedothorax gibbosus]